MSLTPGGQRLAAAGGEILGLADEARRSVGEAGAQRSALRVAATSTAAEYAARALVNGLTQRTRTIEGTLGLAEADRYAALLLERRVDATVGPRPADHERLGIRTQPILRYRAILVAAPDHPLVARRAIEPSMLEGERWLLGPSPVSRSSFSGAYLRRHGLRVDARAFPSHAAALDAAAAGFGIKLVVAHAVRDELRLRTLVRLDVAGTPVEGQWHLSTLADHQAPPEVFVLRRYATSPEALHAMLAREHGVPAQRFRPTLHVTLWS